MTTTEEQIAGPRTTEEQTARGLTDLRAAAPAVLARIAEGSARREAERILPHEQIRELAAAGLLTWRVPQRDGGPGAGFVEFLRFVVDLAEADANITQAVRSHFAFVENLRRQPDQAVRDRWFPKVLAGDVVGLASGEIGAAQGVLRTRLTRDDVGGRVTGDKFYTTGTLFADWIQVGALDDDEQHVSFVVPATREGVERLDDWDGIGQRLTASGSTRFHAVAVHADEFLPTERGNGKRPKLSPFFQLYLAAIQVGISRNALADAVDYARRKARPIKHAGVATSGEDPYVRHAVGDMAARTYAAEAVVLHAAELVAVAETDGPDEEALLLEASLAVSKAQYVVTEAALSVGQTLFDVGGASTAQRSHNLDRHWRNSRTVANHNPRAHKAAAVGAYLLTGEEPATTGFF